MVLQLDDRGIIMTCAACGQKNRLVFEQLGSQVRCGTCKNELPMPSVPIDITSSADFDRLVGRASIPIVVDYWTPWCGPCRMVAPEIARVAARSAGRFVVVKVNTDVLDELGQRFGIRSIPTLAVFAGGRELGRTAGARPAREIEAFVEQTTGAPHG